MAAKRRGLAASLGLSLGLAAAPGCSTRQEPPTPREERAAPPTRDAAAEVAARLRAYAVFDDRFARPVLYTWTTAAQIAELRASPILLSRESSPERGPSRFDQLLAAREGDPIAALLRRPGLAKRRFAWPSPWATRMGWEGESYGDRLIQIRLREEAWIGAFDPQASPAWAFVDLEGRPVELKEVEAHPERIAAIYHRSAAPHPYREYVLCNEAMIEEWAYSTEQIRAELEREIADLEALQGLAGALAPPALEPWGAEILREIWPGPGAEGLAASYAAGLAFPNSLYRPTPENLEALLAALRAALPVEAPLLHRPARGFALGAPVVTPPPAPPCGPGWSGTYCPPPPPPTPLPGTCPPGWSGCPPGPPPPPKVKRPPRMYGTY